MHIEIEPIGVMRTSFRSKYDAPRQPGLYESAPEAFVDLHPHKNFEQALHDLGGFERIWILSWFDQVSGWKPKVLPPRSYGKRGVFATRSPHRPNPIGLSVARLLEVAGRRLIIADTDLLDGTPVLDIKPYVPYADAFPDSVAGWLTSDIRNTIYTITYEPDAFRDIPVESVERLQLHVERILGLDPMPHPYRRTRKLKDNTYVLAVRQIRVYYTVIDNVISVTAVVDLTSTP